MRKNLKQLSLKKKLLGLCEIPYCRKKHGSASPICSCHAMRKWRGENRLKAQFSDLKNNAKKRHIFFDLTFEQFEKLANEAGYSEKTNSVGKFALTIDRKEGREGYTLDNLEFLTRSANVIKSNYYDKQDHYTLGKI